MSQTRAVSTGLFSIPLTVAPNGAEVIYADVEEVDDLGPLGNTAGYSELNTMMAAVMLNPEVVTMTSANVVAFKGGAGWDIFMPHDGLKITSNAAMDEASMVIAARDVQQGVPTLYVPGRGPVIAAFWQGFISCAEDGYGGGAGAGGWVPEEPEPYPPFQSVFGPQNVTLEFDSSEDSYYSVPVEAGSINGLYGSQHNRSLYVYVAVPKGEGYADPVSLMLSGSSFATQVATFGAMYEESGCMVYEFINLDADLDGVLAAGGTDTITCVVNFA